MESIGAKNVDVIYWGYDPEDYSDISINKEISSKFSILHAGVMGFDRNPKMFFQAISELKDEIPGFEKDFQLILLGQVDHSVKQTIEEFQISELVKYNRKRN